MKIVKALAVVVALLFSKYLMAANLTNIPILCYHNLNPSIPGSMSLTPKKFESQIKWILDNGFTIIPLAQAVNYLQGKTTSLPPKSVVITADDGWKSVYTYMYPIVKKYKIPVTLFIYPQTIANGKNVMSWEELEELQKTTLFDVQSHTYSHPNFKQEKKHLSALNYQKSVSHELEKSKFILEKKLNKNINYLAWPFGIYNDYLEQAASTAGYEMAFTIDAVPATKSFKAMAMPRYMIVEGLTQKTFERIIKSANSE